MIALDAFNVLSHVAGRTDCPPDIAAAILWSLDSLTTPDFMTVTEPVTSPEPDRADPPLDASEFVRPGRPPSISYEDAQKVFREWKALGNVALAAQRVGVSYGSAWAVCRGKTYPEIAGRSHLVNQAEGKKRANLTPETVAEILKASKTTGMAEIGRQMDIPFATVQSVINRRTSISRQVAAKLGMPTVGPNARGPRK